jgi:hypothetical protein
MNKETQFTLANRKQLADTLNRYSELRSRARTKWQEKRRKIVDRFVGEIAKKSGAEKLVPSITAAEKNVKELRAKLEGLGFSLGSDGLFIHENADSLDEKLDETIEKEIGGANAVDERFDEAQVELLTAADLEEARTIIKKLLS